MAVLPRYQKAGVRIRQPQDIDYAGFREQARASNAMSQAFDKMSGFLYKRAEDEAIQAGLNRVEKEGAKSVAQSIKAGGGPKGLQQKTAYEAASRIAVTEIQNEAELALTKVLDEAEKKVTPFQKVQAQLDDITNGFAATLAALDPVSAGTLRSNLTTSTQKAGVRYSDWYVKKQAALASERRTQVGNNDQNNFVKDAGAVYGNFTNTLKLNKDIEAKGKEYVEKGGWSPKKAEAWVNETKAKAQEQWWAFKINNAGPEKLEQIRDDVTTGKLRITGKYTEDIKYANAANQQLQTHISASKAEAASIKADVQEKRAILLNGGMEPDADWFSQLDTRIDSNGVFSAQNRAEIAELKLLSENSKTWKQMSASQLGDVIKRIDTDGIPGYGKPGKDTAFEINARNFAETFYASAKTIEDANKKREQDILNWQTTLDKNLTTITNQAISGIESYYTEQERQEAVKLQKEENLDKFLDQTTRAALTGINAYYADQERKELAKWTDIYRNIETKRNLLAQIFKSEGKVNVSQITDLVKALTDIPVKYRSGEFEQTAAAIQFLMQAQNIMDKAPKMSKEELASAMKEAVEGVDPNSENPLDTLTSIALRDSLQEYAANRQRGIEADKLLYASKNGVENPNGDQVEFLPFDFTVKDGDTSQSLGERIKAQFQSRKGFADLAHAKYGGEYRLFTNVEIEQFKQLLDGAQNATSPVTTQMSILSAMFESAGPATSRAMLREIAPKMPEYANVGTLLANPATVGNAQAILEGKLKIEVGDFKIPNFTDPAVSQVLLSQMEPMFGYHAASMSTIQKTAKYIYATMVDADDVQLQQLNEDKYLQAFNMALGAVYDNSGIVSGGVQNYRDMNTFIPPSYTLTDVENDLKKITKDNILQVIDDETAEYLTQDVLDNWLSVNPNAINHLTGKQQFESYEVEGVTIREPSMTSVEAFPMEMVSGNIDTGYVYEFNYPGTSEYFSFEADGAKHPIRINLKKLREVR